MSIHMFDGDVAKEVGVTAAVVFQNIFFWCERNAANGENVHEGRAWTYNSTRALAELFPYLTADQVRRALDKLEEVGLIGVGNFNKTQRDRTKWFCVLRQVHLAKLPSPFGENPRPLPDSKPDINTDIKHAAQLSLEVQEAEKPKDDGFNDFWEAYPKCPRKTGKPQAHQAWCRIITGKSKDIPKTEAKVIIEAVKRFAASGQDPQFIPLPTTWLNGARWDQFQAPVGGDSPRPPGRPSWGEVVR